MLVNFTFDSKPKVDDQQAEYQKRLYEKYSADRSELNRNALEVGGRYDKAVFVLAGGSLALSLTFIEKIAPDPTVLSTLYLGISWLFFVASLIVSLLAMSKSQSAIQWQIEQLDVSYKVLLFPSNEGASPSSQPPVEAQNPHIAPIRRMDTAARVILVYGMICLCAFALLNVIEKEKANGLKSTSSSISPSANRALSPSAGTIDTQSRPASSGNIHPSH